jgi:hypothetical protein
MVHHITRDLEQHPSSDCVTVTLGDYIDRGPDSRGVIDRLVQNRFQQTWSRSREITSRCSSCFSAIPRSPSIGGD